MKRKNPYMTVFIVWAISSVVQCVLAVVNFINGNIIQGTLFTVFSVAFSFVGGIYLQKGIMLREKIMIAEFFEDMAEELKQKKKEEDNIPFEEFIND